MGEATRRKSEETKVIGQADHDKEKDAKRKETESTIQESQEFAAWPIAS